MSSYPAETGKTLFFEVEGGKIAYDDTGGDGQLIIALPGMGDLRSQFRYLGPALRNAGYRVVSMDVRGFGETSARWADYSARAVGRDALALMRHLGVNSAVLVGISFAAGSALWAAHDAPASVRGAVLLGPTVRDQKISGAVRFALAFGFAGPWRVWFWTTYWNSLFPTRKPADQAEAKAALSRNLREPGRMAALREMIALSKTDTAAMLSSTTVPTLVVMGTKDGDYPDPTAEANWLAETLRGECLIVEGAGHYPQAEFPEKVAPKIVSFIHSLPANVSARSSR